MYVCIIDLDLQLSGIILIGTGDINAPNKATVKPEKSRLLATPTKTLSAEEEQESKSITSVDRNSNTQKSSSDKSDTNSSSGNTAAHKSQANTVADDNKDTAVVAGAESPQQVNAQSVSMKRNSDTLTADDNVESENKKHKSCDSVETTSVDEVVAESESSGVTAAGNT